ncbi:MAG: lysophospholipid acyltransferase family protein [Ahrensia sp.]|nr:lysophospholipid acyltransferase family protein [Ahrensia sp.]
MLYLRSFAFNLAWYLNLIVQMVVQSPYYFAASKPGYLGVVRRWAWSCHWLQRALAGTKIEISGLENVPEGGCIIASKHQSIWEFYALFAELDDPAFVLKDDLLKIPLFGWYVAKADQIPIRRGDKGKALRHMLKRAGEALADGRQILIFPEGTRKAPGAEPDYRYGVTRMYVELDCPVVPVALDSGLFWPRRQFLRYPGILRAQFLKPIKPGLDAEAFSARLQKSIEDACDDLYAQTVHDPIVPPLSDKVRAAIERSKARRHVEKS